MTDWLNLTAVAVVVLGITSVTIVFPQHLVVSLPVGLIAWAYLGYSGGGGGSTLVGRR